jgi:hypothetical protein
MWLARDCMLLWIKEHQDYWCRNQHPLANYQRSLIVQKYQNYGLWDIEKDELWKLINKQQGTCKKVLGRDKNVKRHHDNEIRVLVCYSGLKRIIYFNGLIF